MSATSFVNPLPAPLLSTIKLDRVQVFEGDGVPREIEALGLPDHIHRPNMLYACLVKCRYVLALVLIGAAGGTFAYLHEILRAENKLDQLYSLSGLVAFGLIGTLVVTGAVLLALMRGGNASVFFYDQAAVVVEGKKSTLIPWTQLLWVPGRILTERGEQFRCAWMEDHDRFEERIWAMTSEHWVPAQLAKIKAGEAVTSGDISLTASEITCQGKSASWDSLTNMIKYGPLLTLHTSDSSWVTWAQMDMNQTPNGRGMEELITTLCPQNLLVPVE